MAWRRKREVGEAFRNDPHLQQFVLNGVTSTGRVLGTGSYGSVEEVSYKHLICAGKKLHATLLDVENEGVGKVVRTFLKECQLMSSLHHPNITQFLGLCFFQETQLPLLVMERLESSLDDLLEHMPNLPLSIKCSILVDVARGLLYLHDRTPPVIHRDLTSKNVLLTNSLVAKITDMGNSRIVNMRPGQTIKTLTKYPGTLVYMPPEAQDDIHRYGPSLDVFSFGHLALYTLLQEFPGDLLPSTYINPGNNHEVLGRTEIERRGPYIQLLEAQLGTLQRVLVNLVKQCLHNDPNERPSSEELLIRLQKMKIEMEGQYGQDTIKIDLIKVKMAKQLQEKDSRIDELTKQQLQMQTQLETELDSLRTRVEETVKQLDDKTKRVRELQGEVQAKSSLSSQLNNEITTKISLVEDFKRQVTVKERCIEELQAEVSALREDMAANTVLIAKQDKEIVLTKAQLEDIGTREAKLRRQLVTLKETLRESTKHIHGDTQTRKELPLQLTWQRCPDMPFGMSDSVQSVVMQGRLYVGGGYTGWGKDSTYIVAEYTMTSKKWATLLPYTARDFAMAAIKNQLVLIGGWKHSGVVTKAVGVWDQKAWVHIYPEMPTARSLSSAVVYTKWLVVAGGVAGAGYLSCGEVLDTDTNQWSTGPSTPIPWHSMKAALVGETAYFMGGFNTTGYAKVYSASIKHLVQYIFKIFSEEGRQIWEEIPGLPLTSSTPLSIDGSLLAVGGQTRDNAVSSIYLYLVDDIKWIWVGDLPSPRYDCACAMTKDREIIVAGGMEGRQRLKRVDSGVIA